MDLLMILAALTGESVPVHKLVGAFVFAGTINGSRSVLLGVISAL